jgi:hypothetical protein
VKPFSAIAALVLAVVAVLHLLRFILGWEIVINGMSIPLWASAVASLLAAGLAIMAWREATRR